MPIKTKKIPPGLSRAMQRMGDIKRQDPRVGEAFEKARREPRNRNPHPIFTVDLADIAGEAGLSKARQIGWRLLSQGAQGSDFSFELEGEEDSLSLSLVNEGQFVSGTRRLLKELELHKDVKQRDYTFAALRIPALYVMALWLQPDDDSKPELIIPIEPAHPDLETGRTYTPEELHAALRKAAKSMLEKPAAPEPEAAEGKPPTAGAAEELKQDKESPTEQEPEG